MAKPLLPDALWAIIEPLLPPLPPPSPKGGRPPLPHRQALTGILFVLKTGLPGAGVRGAGEAAAGAVRGPGVRLGGPRGPAPVDGGRAAVRAAGRAARERAGEAPVRGGADDRRGPPEPPAGPVHRHPDRDA